MADWEPVAEQPFGADDAAPTPYEVYEVTSTAVSGFGTEETFGWTRWRF